MTGSMLNEGRVSRGAIGRQSDPAYRLQIDGAQARNFIETLDDGGPMEQKVKLDALEGYLASQRGEDYRNLRGMYLDPAKWWKGEGDDRVDDETKQEIANRRMIAHMYGQTTDEQAKLYPSYRDQFFTEVFGAAPASEAEAFATLQKGMVAQDQTEKAMRELPSTLALNIMRAAAGGTDSPELAGMDVYNAWKERHADILDALPEDWESRAMEQAEAIRENWVNLMRDIGPDAKEAWDILQKWTRPERTYSGEAPKRQRGRGRRRTQPDTEVADQDPVSREDIENLARKLTALPADQQERIFSALYVAAEATGAGMGRGFFEKVGEGMVRGGVRIYDEAAMTQQDRSARQNLARLRRGETLYEMADGMVGTPDDIARLASTGNYNATKLLAEPSFQAGTGNIDGERRQQLITDNEQRLRELATLRKVRELAAGRIDPLKTELDGLGGMIVQGAYDFSQSAAYTAMAAIPYVGLPAVAYSLGNSNYLRMLDEYPDIDPDFAFNLSMAIGLPQAFVERFKANALLGKSPALNRLMKKMTDARMPLSARIAAAYGSNVAYQTGQEFIQEAMPTLADQIAAAIREDMPEFDAQQAWGAYIDEAPAIFFSMLWAGLIGGGVVTLREFKRDGIFLTNITELEMQGIVGETARDIAAEQDIDVQNEKHKAALNNRKPEDIKAGIAKRAAQLEAAGREQGAEMPRREVTTDEDGNLVHLIYDSKGNELLRTNDTLAADIAYVGMVKQITGAKLASEADITRSLVQQWEASPEVNEFNIVEKPKTATEALAALKEANRPEQIEVLHRRIENSPYKGMSYDDIYILGETTVQDIGDMVLKATTTLYGGAGPLATREEMHHAALRRSVMRGEATEDELRGWLAATEDVLGQKFPRNTFDDIVESMAIVQRAFEDGQINAEQETGLPPSFVDYIRRMIAAFGEVLKRALALRNAFDAGVLPADYEAFLINTTQASPQAIIDSARERTAKEVGAAENYSIGVREPDALGFNETTLPDGNVRFIAYHGSEQSLSQLDDRPIYVSSLADGAGYGATTRMVIEGRFLPVDQIEAFAAKYGIAMEDLFHEEASMEQDLQEALRSEGYDGAIYYDQRRDDGDVMPAAVIVNPQAIRVAPTNYSIGALGDDNPFMHPRGADGKYKGAPKWINAPETRRGKNEAYKRLRERLYQLVQEGAAGRFWYEDSGRAVLRMFNNNVVEAEKFIELLAIYSPQATVEVNTYFALRAYIQRAVNAAKEDFAVKTGAQDDKAKSVLYDNQPWAGRKTDNFYKNIMYVLLKELPASEVAKLKLDAEVYEMLQKPVTVDMWVYRAFGFDSDALTDVAGTGAFGFAERELNLIAEELNSALPEGAAPYLPHQIQAMLWTAIKGRAETKEVKDLTEAQSIKAKDMVKVKNAQGKLVREFKDKEAQKRHMQRWITNALALPAEKLDVSMAAGAFDRFINSVSMRALWESVPSTNTPEGAAIANLTTAQKAAFTRASREIILDENGNDMLAAMLGVPINVSQLLSGGYGTGATPNVVTELFPNKPSGTYDDDIVRAYARAIQYIYRQDAVPWMRYIKFGAQTENSYYTQSPKGSKRTFRTQAEAQAFIQDKIAAATTTLEAAQKRHDEADSKPETKEKKERMERAQASVDKARAGLEEAKGYTVRGEAENFALMLDFGMQLTPEFLDQFQQGLVKVHESLGFTQVSPTEVIVTNFRDSDTGLPALTDEAFYESLTSAYGEQANIQRLHTVGEYGPVHDWSQESSGASILSASSRFTPDLLEWLRGRRQVSDALQKDWAEGRGVSNYSISTQRDIDRVSAAMAKMTRGPDARTQIYERAKLALDDVLQANWEILRGMEGVVAPEQIRRTQVLQTFGVLDAVLQELPPEVRGKIGFSNISEIAPVDVFKDGEKVSEANTARGGMISAWMREGMSIGMAGKQTALPEGYSVRESMDTARADKAIVSALRAKFDAIDRALERTLREDYRYKIDKLIEQTKPKKDERRILKGRLTPEISAMVEEADRLRSLNAGQTTDKIQSLYAQLDAAKDPDQIEALVSELTMVQLFGNFDKLDSVTLADAFTFLSALVQQGRDIRKVLDEERRARMEELRGIAVEEFSGGKGIVEQPVATALSQRRQKQKIRQAVYDFHLKNQSFEWLLNAATRPDKRVGTLAGRITQTFSKLAHRATHQERRRKTARERAAHEKLAQIFGVKVGLPLANAQYKWRTQVSYDTGVIIQKTEEVEVPVETAQKAVDGVAKLDFSQRELGILRELLDENEALPPRNRKGSVKLRRAKGPKTEMALSQDTALYYYMLSKQDGPRESLEYWGWDEASFAALEAFLAPETRQIHAWLSREYHDGYFAINRVYRQVHNVNMPRVENYSPVNYDVDAKLEENLMDNDHMMSSSSPSFVRSRVRHRAEVRERGALDMYFRHLVDSEHYMAWALPMRDMRAVLGHKDVQRVINQQQGAKLAALLNDKLDQFAAGGRKAAFTLPLLDNIRSSFVIAKQSFNWGVMIKQLTSFPAYMYDVPFLDFFKYEAEFWMNPVKAMKTITSLPFTSQRFGEGFDRDMLRVTKQFEGLDAPRNRAARAAEWGMIAVKFGDIVPVVVGGYAAYRYKYDQVFAQTKDAKQAQEEAVLYFEMVTERAQQAGDVKDLSFYQSGGSIARMISMFKTAPRQYYSNVYESMLDWRAGKEGAGAEFARRLFIGQVVLPVAFQMAGDLVRNAFREPDERELDPMDYVRAILLGPLNGLFVIGGILESASYWFIKGRWFDHNALTGLSEMERVYRSIGRVGTMIKDGEIDAEKTMKTLDDLAIATSSMMGGGYVWYDVGRRLIRSVGLDDEMEALTGDFLDWAEDKTTK